jgi:hypothetical protein
MNNAALGGGGQGFVRGLEHVMRRDGHSYVGL